MKLVTALTPHDLWRFPLWRFANSDHGDELAVESVSERTVASLLGVLIGTQVLFRNGFSRWALIGNVDHLDPTAIEHFLTLSLWHCDAWLRLARYHDIDYDEKGPVGFAKAIALSAEEIFPIAYDLRQYVTSHASILKGNIPHEPRKRLSRAELIHLAAGTN